MLYWLRERIRLDDFQARRAFEEEVRLDADVRAYEGKKDNKLIIMY